MTYIRTETFNHLIISWQNKSDFFKCIGHGNLMVMECSSFSDAIFVLFHKLDAVVKYLHYL